jgi:hypothetical protein
MDCRRLTGGWVVALALAGRTAAAQTPSPTPPPERLRQDDLDLQGRANVVQGAGARALGMGGAFLARADDATAASWNPAGLSYLRLPELSAVWAQSATSTHESPNDPKNGNKSDRGHGGTPDFFAVTYPAQIRGVSGAVQVSFQRVISFRSTRTIEDQAPRTSDGGGGFDVLAAGTGVQVARWLRLGATVNRWFNGYSQHVVKETAGEFRPGTSVQDAQFRLSAWNANAGIIWSPRDNVSIGAVGKTPFSAAVTLSRERVDRVITVDGVSETGNDYTRSDVVLDFPGAIGIGASLRPRSALTVSVDYTRSYWSKGKIHNFFTLPRQGIPADSPDDFFPELPYPTLIDPHQRDTEQIRGGLEYVWIHGRLKWPLRFGYFKDRQFFRALDGVCDPAAGEPEVANAPGARPRKCGGPRFDAWTAGAGLIVGPVLFDVAYIYEHGRYVSLAVSDVRLRSHRVFASLIYRHGRH